jgi:hypothetical protein
MPLAIVARASGELWPDLVKVVDEVAWPRANLTEV